MIRDMQKIAHCCSYVHYDGMSHYENLHNSLHSTVVPYSLAEKIDTCEMKSKIKV